MRAMTSTQALEAAQLSKLGLSVEGIRVQMGLKCSRQTVWRAVRKVMTTQERITAARKSGNYDFLSTGEAVIALEPDRPKGGLTDATAKNG